MKGLYKVLPPFAPDYSGVCSVLFELGGIVVVHDASGCTGNFTGYDEPRWYGSSSAVFSSGLREVESVLGTDEKMLCKIENAVRTMRGRFVAIIGSPAPMIIGTDYRALANILSQRIGLPILTFDTNGIRYYDDGASLAFLELARHFVKPADSRIATGVNIIGATPLDLGNNRQIGKIRAMLSDAGCHVISCWAMGSTLDDIAQSAQARLNVVVSRAGMEAARYMKHEHQIPYFMGIPIGPASSRCFVHNIRWRLGLTGELGLLHDNRKQVGCDPNALVIGEQVMSNAIRECLRLDMGIGNATVASFFHMDQELLEDSDVFLDSEDALTALTTKYRYDVVVGDPLYRDLLPSSWEGCFVDFPHVALSSRLYWDQDFNYIGEASLTLFTKESLMITQDYELD